MPLILTRIPFPVNFSQIAPFLIYFILCFSPLIEGGTTYYAVTIIQIVLLIIFISGVFSFYRGDQSLSLKSPLFYAILIFFTYSIIIAFLTPYKLPAFQQVQLLFFYFVLIYFSILFHLTQKKYKETLLNLLFLMGLFESIYGIGQFVFFHHRAKGTFFNPDFFGEYLAIIFCVQLGRCFDGHKRRVIASETKQSGLITLGLPRTLWALAMINRFVDILSLLLLATGIFLSQSRGAALAWSIGISFVLWERFKYGVVYAWFVLLFLLVIIPNPLQHRILKDYQEDPYSLSRIEMWKEAGHIIKDHPLGIGLEMYPLISPQYAFPIKGPIQQYGKVAESPHDGYLRLFAEFGVPGATFVIFGIFLFYFKWIDFKDKSFMNDGILGGTLIFFVHALVDSNFREPALVITSIILSTFLVDKNLFHFVVLVRGENRKAKTIFTLYLLFLILSANVIKPAIGWYYYSKGYGQIKNHQNETALNYFQKAIYLESQNARYHNALANSYFNIFEETNYYGWVFRALDELNIAIHINSVDGSYLKLKGAIYKTLAERESQPDHIEELYNDAFTNYKEALKLLPYDASIYLDLGEIHSYFQRFNDAETAYNQAMILEPNYLMAREKKIEIQIKTGKQEEAVKEYEKLVLVYDQVKNRSLIDSEKNFIYFNQEKLKKEIRFEEK